MRFTGRHSMDGVVSAALDSYVACLRMVPKTIFTPDSNGFETHLQQSLKRPRRADCGYRKFGCAPA